MVIAFLNSTFGKPDRIIFHTNQWDLPQQVVKSESEFEALRAIFRRNTNQRIDQILQLNDRSVDIGLRTAVWNQQGGKLLSDFNRITREIATERNMTVYDFDVDAWSTVSHNFTKHSFLYRDMIHPKQIYTARAGEKMLGRQYSSAITFRDALRTNGYTKRFDDPSSNLSTVHLWHGIDIDRIFFVNRFNRSRHADPDEGFISALRLGPYDIRHVASAALCKKTDLGESVPKKFLDRTVFNKTSNNELFFYFQSKLRLVRDKSMADRLGVKGDEIVQMSSEGSYFLSLVELDAPIPAFYDSASDFLIRGKGQREVFLVRNATRISVPSVSVMEALGKTFDDVAVISEDLLDFLPLSDIVL